MINRKCIMGIICAFAFAATTLIPCSAQQITVGKNVHVTSNRPSISYDEPSIAASPKDPNKLIACSIDNPTDDHHWNAIAYTSSDGGKTWTQRVSPEWESTENVHCLFGVDGSAIFVAPNESIGRASGVIHSYGDYEEFLNVFRSPDGGQKWLEPTVIRDVSTFQFAGIDRSGGPHNGNLYIVYKATESYGTEPATTHSIALSTSSDGGATFGKPTLRELQAYTSHPHGVAVFADGTVLISARFYPKVEAPEQIVTFTASDAGATLSEPKTLYTYNSPYSGMDPSPPVIDTTDGPFRNRAYLAWPDNTPGRYECVIVHSDDQGQTWSTPKIVSDIPEFLATPDGRRGPDNTSCELAVNKNGVVGMVWYAHRSMRPDLYDLNWTWDTRFRASIDGGETWLPGVKVSEQPKLYDKTWTFSVIDPHVMSGYPKTMPLEIDLLEWESSGHWSSITADAKADFHALWIDDRTGLHQMWTAPISVKGRAQRNGSAELATWHDVSPDVYLIISSIKADQQKGIVTATTQLKNVSTHAIQGPIKVRLLSLRSRMATVEVANADNALHLDGALWDFSKTLRDGTLAPGAMSGTRTLQFRVTGLHPDTRQHTISRGQLLMLDTAILTPQQ